MTTNDVRFLCALAAIFAIHNARLPALATASASASMTAPRSLGNVASTSVLAALLESPGTELMELVEQAGMLESLEFAVDRHNLTIFAPREEFLEVHFDPEFRRFLLLPGNVRFLQQVVMFHILPVKITASQWRRGSFKSLSSNDADEIRLHWDKKWRLAVEHSIIDIPDMIVRRDGVVHRIDGLLIPKSVEDAYSAARLRSLPSSVAVRPRGAPVLSAADGSFADSKAEARLFHITFPTSPPRGSMSSDYLAPAPAPSPSSSSWSHLPGDGHDRVHDLIAALIAYGGYSEMADLLVNLTSLAAELGNLVSEGHRLTVLAPNDRAIDLLGSEHLSAPGGIESILAYHILAEYQTEESLYSLAKRHERVILSTLGEPPWNKLVAREVDGIVEFGTATVARAGAIATQGLLMDPNIYTDRRISVQGINAVLIPLRGRDASPTPTPTSILTSTSTASSSTSAAFKGGAGKPPQRKLWQGFRVIAA